MGQGKNQGQKREMKKEHRLRLSSCEAGGTCAAAGQSGPRPLLLPGPGLESPSPQGAPDRDQCCRDGKQHSFLELLQPDPSMGPQARPTPYSARRVPKAIWERPQSSRAAKPARGATCQGAALLQNIHSAHANIHIHTNTHVHTQTHMHMQTQMYIQIDIPALWAGTWGADTTSYHPPLGHPGSPTLWERSHPLFLSVSPSPSPNRTVGFP